MYEAMNTQLMRARRLFTECRSVLSQRALYIGLWYRRESRAPRSPHRLRTPLVAGFFLISSMIPYTLYFVIIYVLFCVVSPTRRHSMV